MGGWWVCNSKDGGTYGIVKRKFERNLLSLRTVVENRRNAISTPKGQFQNEKVLENGTIKGNNKTKGEEIKNSRGKTILKFSRMVIK